MFKMHTEIQIQKYWRAVLLHPFLLRLKAQGFLGQVKSTSVDPVCFLATLAAVPCPVCVPVFHIWQSVVLKWALT